MLDKSLKGPLTETVDAGELTPELAPAPSDAEPIAGGAEPETITMLIECPGYEAADGVIDLGDAGIITKTAPVPAASIDNSGRPPSVVDDDPAVGHLTLIPGEFLTGTAGADVLTGGTRPDVIEGLGGDDILRGKAGSDLILGGGGDDRIMGNSGRDNIRGNDGDDIIRAGAGNDFVKGGQGADRINGGGGDDRLAGGAGDDTIIGRTGDDTLKGNGGADVFQFRPSDRNDTILDFEQGQDRIEILSGAESFGDLTIEQDGANVLISFGSGQVTIISDDAGSFEASDFIF